MKEANLERQKVGWLPSRREGLGRNRVTVNWYRVSVSRDKNGLKLIAAIFVHLNKKKKPTELHTSSG